MVVSPILADAERKHKTMNADKNPSAAGAGAVVTILMGSKNDWPVMRVAAEILRDFDLPWEAHVISAHRAPDLLAGYVEKLAGRGVRAVIAGAGGAAHLPGVIAAKTALPVLGVPIAATPLNGADALHAIVQMPRGIPVATFAVGEAGAANAALFAVAILAGSDDGTAQKLAAFRKKQAEKIAATPPLTLD